MARYNDLINRLLLEEPSNLEPDTYLFSLYIDTYAKSRSQVETYINSSLKKGFKTKEVLKEKDKVKKAISERVFRAVSTEESFKRGLVIFLRFTLDGKVDNFELIHLHDIPKKEVYIGKIYDLDQLIWINNMRRDALVVNLEVNDAKVYELRGSDFLLIKELEYELDDDVREFVHQYSPIKGKGGVFQSGGGGGTTDNDKREFLKKFFAKVLDYIKKNYKEDSSLDYVLLFHSSAYEFMSDDMSKKIKRDIAVTPLVFTYSINKKNELRKKSKEEILNFERTLKRDLLGKAKESNALYVQDWYDVCEAVNMARIKNLFIQLNASKEGYVKNNGLIYTQPVTESRKVKNIASKIIRKVLEQSGKVYVIEDESLLEEDIAAQLRY
jgi:hypothetical protein